MLNGEKKIIWKREDINTCLTKFSQKTKILSKVQGEYIEMCGL